jgi:hypothetical protein
MTFPCIEILICKIRCSILAVMHSGVHTRPICTVCASLISSYRHESALNAIQGECRNTLLSPNAPLYTLMSMPPRTSPYHTSNRIYVTCILAVRWVLLAKARQIPAHDDDQPQGKGTRFLLFTSNSAERRSNLLVPRDHSVSYHLLFSSFNLRDKLLILVVKHSPLLTPCTCTVCASLISSYASRTCFQYNPGRMWEHSPFTHSV